jgi:outer membrane lipoprotein-sorting protein
MIPFLILQVAAAPKTGAAILDRMSMFTKRVQTLSVDIKLSSPKAPSAGVARFVFQRPGSAMMDIKWPPVDYRFTGSKLGALELDRNRKLYDESPDYPQLMRYGSRISEAPSLFFPDFLFTGDFSGEGVSQVAYKGAALINGVSADEVEGQASHKKIQAFIAADGKLMRYIMTRDTGFRVQADFSNYVVNKPVPASTFSFNPPAGWAQYSVPTDEAPLGIGEPFPTAGWVNTRGAKRENLSNLASKPLLAMVAGPNCEPSAKSATFLQRMQDSGEVQVVVITNSIRGIAPVVLSGFPQYYDPTGILLKQLKVPGTPVFYLLGRNGTVKKVWYGFDPRQATSFERDVRSVLRESG